MKKLILLLIMACILVASSCSFQSETAAPLSQTTTPAPTPRPAKTISPDQIKTFSYSIEDFGVYDEYSVSRDDLTAKMLLHDYYLPEIQLTQTWTEEKWNSFTKDLLACGIADWELEYYDEGYYTGDLCYDGGWNLYVTGEFGTIASEGGEPPDDGQFSRVFSEYFLLPKPESVNAQANPIDLVAEVTLSEPEAGEWYDWDKAGVFTLNPRGFLYYKEDQDLLIREHNVNDYNLYISNLNGSEKKVITDEFYNFNYFDGWIFYHKWQEGVWKCLPDGTGEQFVANIDEDVWIYNNSLYYFEYNTDDFCCYNLDNNTLETKYLPGYPVGPYFFENGYFYYSAVSPDDDHSDRLSIYRYDLETRLAVELTNRSMGDFAVRDGMLYYIDEGLMRTDGNTTENVKSRVGYYFNRYRNYLFYINYKRDWTCMLYALNLDTGTEYELFEIPVPFGSRQSDIYVMENTIFLHNALYESSPVFRITFEGDTARLWKLNGLAK